MHLKDECVCVVGVRGGEKGEGGGWEKSRKEKKTKKKEAKLMKRTLLAWSRSEPICVHLHLGWNLQLRASRRCIMTGCHNNTGGGPAGKMTALSLLRKDETLATCNSPRSAASFLPAAWLNGTFEGSKSTKLCLITLPEPECLTGWGVFVGGGEREAHRVKRDLSFVCARRP